MSCVCYYSRKKEKRKNIISYLFSHGFFHYHCESCLLPLRILPTITANITGKSRYIWLRARTATRRLLINSRPHATNIASMCGYCYRKGDKKHFKVSKPVLNGNTFPRVGSALRYSVKSATIGFFLTHPGGNSYKSSRK